jgi:hypothetical protein
VLQAGATLAADESLDSQEERLVLQQEVCIHLVDTVVFVLVPAPVVVRLGSVQQLESLAPLG